MKLYAYQFEVTRGGYVYSQGGLVVCAKNRKKADGYVKKVHALYKDALEGSRMHGFSVEEYELKEGLVIEISG